VVSEPAAKSRTNDKAEAESRADQSERLGTLFRRRDVGYIGERSGDIGGSNSRYEASHKKPTQRRGDSHKNVVEPDTQAGKQDDRAAAETIGPSSEDGRKDELHGGPGKAEVAGYRRGAGKISLFELTD